MPFVYVRLAISFRHLNREQRQRLTGDLSAEVVLVLLVELRDVFECFRVLSDQSALFKGFNVLAQAMRIGKAADLGEKLVT